MCAMGSVRGVLPRNSTPASRATASSRTRRSTWQATSTVLWLTCRSENTTQRFILAQSPLCGTLAARSTAGRTAPVSLRETRCSSAASTVFFLRPRFLGAGLSAAASVEPAAPAERSGSADGLRLAFAALEKASWGAFSRSWTREGLQAWPHSAVLGTEEGLIEGALYNCAPRQLDATRPQSIRCCAPRLGIE